MAGRTGPLLPVSACPICGSTVYNTIDTEGKTKLMVDQLPTSDKPWIAIKFCGLLLWANEDYPPIIMAKDGEMIVAEGHVANEESTFVDLDEAHPDLMRIPR